MSPLRITCFVSRLRLSVNLLPKSPASSWAAVQIIFWRPPERTDLVKIFVCRPFHLWQNPGNRWHHRYQEALNKLNRITKQRKSYHKYFTGKEWEDDTNYDLPINASKLELDQVVELIKIISA